MGPSLELNIALATLAPFAAAVLAPLVHRLAGAAAGWVLALVPAGIFVFFVTLVAPVAQGEVLRAGFDWVPAHGIGFTLLVDGLSLVFALAISGIGALILVYSGAYLAGHPHQGRFLGFMLAFTGAMLGLVLADSLLVLFVFWELTSVASFLLIGFDHARQAARRAAIQALVVTNIGGLALLVAAVLVRMAAGGWEIADIGAALEGHALYGPVLGAVLLAAFTKSAQLPFHFWLPNAMEAPTPVSAFLHSATMVQGGVYLLARLSPALGGTEAWTAVLVPVGGATLLWGALAALKQTDLKQMLAQTTLASLGLLVLLLGIGSEAAVAAMVVYFVAHAAYKAALFLVVGSIDHGTGTRDLTALGGLGRKMPLSFAAAALAGLSMVGLPLSLGFLAKEEMYLALAGGGWQAAVLVVLVLGNGLLAAVGIAVALKPFAGAPVETPRAAHEGSPGLLAGPVLLALAGIGLALAVTRFGDDILAPAASAVLGETVGSHLALLPDVTSPILWLSVLTWGVGIAAYLQLGLLRRLLRRADAAIGWSFDRGFDAAMFGLIRLAGAVTRFFHHGRLELYLAVVFALFAAALFLPLALPGGLDWLRPPEALGQWAPLLSWPLLAPHEWAVALVAVMGLVALVLARSRLVAILSMGVQGVAVAMLFLLFGAPDLAFTQFMVEVLSVVILTLVMTRLRLDERDERPFEDALRDGTLAVACGAGVALLLSSVLTGVLDTRLSETFAATSVPLAHGHNIVNVILVDYRGFDTLGEIAVVMTAGIAILALIRGQNKAPARTRRTPRAARTPRTSGTAPAAPRRRRRRGNKTEAGS